MINNQSNNTNVDNNSGSNLPADWTPLKGNFFNLDPSAVIPDIKLDLNFNGLNDELPDGTTKSFAT